MRTCGTENSEILPIPTEGQFTKFKLSRYTVEYVYLYYFSFVCESLVRHLSLSGNVLVWSETFDLVQEIVGGVHYKGCRDIMKLLFDKFDHLPRQIPEDQVVALLKGQKVSWIA